MIRSPPNLMQGDSGDSVERCGFGGYDYSGKSNLAVIGDGTIREGTGNSGVQGKVCTLVVE